jgi:hypothetical protein
MRKLHVPYLTCLFLAHCTVMQPILAFILCLSSNTLIRVELRGLGLASFDTRMRGCQQFVECLSSNEDVSTPCIKLVPLCSEDSPRLGWRQRGK